MKPGDEVTAVGNPSRNGSYTMRIHKIIFSDGRELSFEGPGGS